MSQNWSNTVIHPLKVGDFIKAIIPPCGTCNKMRNYVPGLPALKETLIEGQIDYVFNRSGINYYRIKTGKLIEDKHVKSIKV